MSIGPRKMAHPTILLVTEAAHADMDRVLDAMGRGDKTFEWGRQIVEQGTTGPVLYRAALDMGADAEYAAALRAMAEAQTLPEIDGEWGVDGVIGATDAQYAMLGFRAFTAASTDINGYQWMMTVLDGFNLVLKPDEEGYDE